MSRNKAQEDFEAELIFHEREWRIQRIGWILVAIFLALALGGLFGGGPLSRAHKEGVAGRIEYQRFVRNGLSTTLVVTPAGHPASGVHHVQISADYIEAFRVERITPEPTAVRITGSRLVYEFAGAAPDVAISFHLHPQRLWRHTAAVRIDDGEPLAISQLTYP